VSQVSIFRNSAMKYYRVRRFYFFRRITGCMHKLNDLNLGLRYVHWMPDGLTSQKALVSQVCVSDSVYRMGINGKHSRCILQRPTIHHFSYSATYRTSKPFGELECSMVDLRLITNFRFWKWAGVDRVICNGATSDPKSSSCAHDISLPNLSTYLKILIIVHPTIPEKLERKSAEQLNFGNQEKCSSLFAAVRLLFVVWEVTFIN